MKRTERLLGPASGLRMLPYRGLHAGQHVFSRFEVLGSGGSMWRTVENVRRWKAGATVFGPYTSIRFSSVLFYGSQDLTTWPSWQGPKMCSTHIGT